MSRAWLTLVLLLVAASARASTCALGCAPCSVACDGGCTSQVVTGHGRATCSGDGSLNLLGTGYESTCASGTGGCTVATPSVRLWQFGGYAGASSGCADATGFLANASLDLGIAVADGHWLIDGLDWTEAGTDGCIDGGPSGRVVFEASFADPALEGTFAHRGLYVIASVDATAVGFEQPNAVDPELLDVPIEVPSVEWYTEAGKGAGPDLIAGYQVLYATGDPPTSSDACVGGWRPALDPLDPALAAAAIPPGATATVTFPGFCRAGHSGTWLALRVVYEDPSNPTGTFDPSIDPGPVLTSAVGSNIGPLAVPFEPPVMSTWVTLRPSTPVVAGVPVVLDIDVQVGYLEVSPTLVFDIPSCLDASDFDPAARPWQIEWRDRAWSPDPVWDAGTRTLTVQTSLEVFRDTVRLSVHGLHTATDDPSCCVTGHVTWLDFCGPGDKPTAPACITIDSSLACPAPPAIVSGLRAVDRGWSPDYYSVDLSWDQAIDPETIAYDVYRIHDGPASLIPLANQDETAKYQEIASVCAGIPVDRPSCQTTWWAGPSEPHPALVYFQVRGLCSDGREGTDHPF